MFNFNQVPRLSEKEFLILQLLVAKGKELYGLEMIDQSDGKLKKGTVYVTLGRLEDKGFIESRKEEPRPGARGLPRRLYKLTGIGQRTYDGVCAAVQNLGGALA